MNKRKVIFIIASLAWMIMIYSFSSRNGVESTGDSNQIGMLIGKTLIPSFEKWDEGKQQQFAERIDYPIRKTAHAMEYAVLGLFLTLAYVDINNMTRWKRFIPWILGTVYAMTDEFHQLFVPGRSGRVTDVLIDSTGVMIGVLVTYWFVSTICRKRKNRLKGENVKLK